MLAHVQAQEGHRVREAFSRVLQEDGRWMKRLHNEAGMCLNCNWEEVDLELSAQVCAPMPHPLAACSLWCQRPLMPCHALICAVPQSARRSCCFAERASCIWGSGRHIPGRHLTLDWVMSGSECL